FRSRRRAGRSLRVSRNRWNALAPSHSRISATTATIFDGASALIRRPWLRVCGRRASRGETVRLFYRRPFPRSPRGRPRALVASPGIPIEKRCGRLADHRGIFRSDIVRKTAEARILIPSSFWRQFSEDVEEALLSQTQAREWKGAQASLTETPHPEAREEGIG